MAETLRNLNDFVLAAEEAVNQKGQDLFGNSVEDSVLEDINTLISEHSKEGDLHDSDKAHNLYYGVIRKLLNNLPKSDVKGLISLLISNLLTGVEILHHGQYRGSDSRQQSNDKFSEVADILFSSLSDNHYDYMRTAQTLLDKCIEKNISPKNRILKDFM